MSPRRLAVLASTLLLLAAAPLFRAQSASSSQLPAGPLQQKATAACTECHDAGIILQQHLSKAAWTKEVDKMVKWGAVVDTQDHDALVDYLSSNFGVDSPPYQPEKSAATKAKKH